MLESLFNKVVDLKAWNFIKKRLEHRCFPVKLAKFLRTTFLQNTSGGCFWRCFIFYHHDLAKCSVCISCHVTYALQSESTLYSCQGTPCSKQARNLKFKWLDWTRTHNNLVRKRTLTHLAKLNGWVFVYKLIGCGFKPSCSHLNALCFDSIIF